MIHVVFWDVRLYIELFGLGKIGENFEKKKKYKFFKRIFK